MIIQLPNRREQYEKLADTTIEEIKTPENFWGSANLDLLVR